MRLGVSAVSLEEKLGSRERSARRLTGGRVNEPEVSLNQISGLYRRSGFLKSEASWVMLPKRNGRSANAIYISGTRALLAYPL